MLEITYTPRFVRQYNALEAGLREEVVEKIELLKNRDNSKALRVHKLHGKLSTCHSFSVNYKVRVVFEYKGAKEIICHAIGDHDLYR